MRNPDDNPRTDDVEKLLSEQKALEDRKQALIADLPKQKEAAIRDFDEKLARLGHHSGPKAPRRSHHKRPAAAPQGGGAKEKGKPE